MAASNPLSELAADVPAAGLVKYTIAGIEVDVYGLNELNPRIRNVSCLWLLNPRLGNRHRMRPIADAAIHHWNTSSSPTSGLIVAAFDQRNHGSRKMNDLSNQTWRDGNPRHAIDMFSIIQGTAADTSQLITYLPGYTFPKDEHVLIDHFALGISLGGHSTWQLLLHEPRIRTGIVIIGCPDYLGLMSDRARLSKLKTWTQSTPPGSGFIGSEDFPPALVDAIQLYDPTGFFFGTKEHDFRFHDDAGHGRHQAELLKKTLHGKRILNLSGGSDRLVPHAKAAPFLKWLREATKNGGRCEDVKLTVKDIVYPGVGHKMVSGMLADALAFLTETNNDPDRNTMPKL